MIMLLRRAFPDHDYVVFDASLNPENARAEPELFLRNHPPPVILDEIQDAPELVAAIKRAVDRLPGMAGRYLLTGSQQWQVLKNLSESLARLPTPCHRDRPGADSGLLDGLPPHL